MVSGHTFQLLSQISNGWVALVPSRFMYVPLFVTKRLADYSHSLNLIIGLKNCQDLGPQLVDWFDFLLTEQCVEFNECDKGTTFVAKGKAVFK
jgi:hypothetical protein